MLHRCYTCKALRSLIRLDLAQSSLCVNLWAGCWLTIPQLALVGEAGLVVYVILLQRWRLLAKNHLA